MTDWAAFAGFSGVVVLALLALARVSQSMLSAEPSPLAPAEASGPLADGDDPGTREGTDDADVHERGAAAPASAEPRTDDPVAGGVVERSVAPPAERDAAGRPAPDDSAPTERQPGDTPARDRATGDTPTGAREPGALGPMTTGELLVNVLVSHGLFAGAVVGGAVLWAVPASALGVGWPTPAELAGGVALGLALYVLDEVGAVAARRLGVDADESLRELLAPASPRGWALLFGGVLPVIAVSEELLFRGVLVGALSVGFGVSPWVLAALSSAAFALGHGAQGRGGVVVTGLLGFVLAAAFVVSGSLLVVVVAHYLVNALEFAVHEWAGVEWASADG